MECLSSNSLADERENLAKTSPLVILDYIKNTIEILVEAKVEERLESLKKNNTEENEEKSNEYETLLRKLESDIRQHIRVRYKIVLIP
jgi:hypothetical protein